MTLQADKPELPFSPTGGAEQDWVNMLMASPLFQQINDLQDLLEKNSGATVSDKVQGIVVSYEQLPPSYTESDCFHSTLSITGIPVGSLLSDN